MSNTIKKQLIEDMKEAMKARESVRLGVVRFLMSEIKNYEIDNGEQDDAGIQRLVASQVKKMKEAIEEFEKAGRSDLVEEELPKVAVLEGYLPEQMSDEELEKIVGEVMAEMGEVKNVGQVIGAVMKKVAGKADGGRVKEAVMAKTS